MSTFDPEHADRGAGEIAVEISGGIVRLIKEHGGRGPNECRTHIDHDLVIVVMRGGYNRMENTLFEDGKFLDVRQMRHIFQDTMEARFSEVIARATGRAVSAFMSASHQRPDFQMEIFMLESDAVAEDPAADPGS